MKSLKTIGVNSWGGYPTLEKFWQDYDDGYYGKRVFTLDDPKFQQWVKQTSQLPAEQQLKAVVEKLRELNPRYNGSEHHTIDSGVVTAFAVWNNVADISPVRAFSGLKDLIAETQEGRVHYRSFSAEGNAVDGLHARRQRCL